MSKTRRVFRRRLSLQQRRATSHLRCAPMNLIRSFESPWVRNLYDPWRYGGPFGEATPWGSAYYSISDAPIGYIPGGWNFDGPHQPPLWYGQVEEDVAWASDSDYLFTRDPDGSSTSYHYGLPDLDGPYAYIRGRLGPPQAPPRPRGVL